MTRPASAQPPGSVAPEEPLFDVRDLRDAEARVSDELRERLARHLLEGRAASEAAQGLLGALTVGVFWGAVPSAYAFGWLGVFFATIGVRALLRSRAYARATDPIALLGRVRLDVWLTAFLWAAFIVLFAQARPLDLAILMIIVAGLVAAATSTLVADSPSYHGFVGFLIGALAVAIVLNGLTRVHVSMLLLIAVFVPFMVSVHRRAQGILAANIASNVRLRISEEETARGRDFLNALVANAPSAMVVLDREAKVLRVNPAFEHVTGYSWGEVHGRSLPDVLGEGQQASHLASFLDTIREGARSVAELRLKRADGHAIWMRLSGTAAGQQAAGSSIVIGEDVTEQVLAREAQTAARLEAERATRAKSSFLATMSHEIRTPMNGILGMIELLGDTPLTEQQLDSLRVMRSSANGLLRILNDVLDVSKIEAGQLDLEGVDFDLHELLGEIGRVFQFQAGEKAIELVVDVGPAVPSFVHADPLRLRQVLYNLTSNGVKFTSEGEVVLSARVVDGGNPATIRFGVRDTGIGVDPDKHEQIFGEFEQADSSTTRVHGGTGLGLSISRRLVELMGGHLKVESEPGVGSDFHFTVDLPVVELRPGGRRLADTSLFGRRFLVVDDNDTARRIVTETLVAEGAEVLEAADADAGLDRLTGGDGAPTVDAVVLDHLMPRKDGFDFVEEARTRLAAGVPRILMLTSSPAAAEKSRARDLGIGAYLTKPHSRRELTRALRTLLASEPPDGDERRLITRESLSVQRASVRILLAEDNPVNQKVASALLSKRGYHVDVVANGRLAVEAARAGRYDLVLMDIQMPEMDGIEAAGRIHGESPELPIVALTAHAFEDERKRAREAGMVDFLPKPFEPDALYDLVTRWCGAGGRAGFGSEGSGS